MLQISRRSRALLVTGFVGIASLLLILWITPHGLGISPDSTDYIRGAKSLLAGKGYTAFDGSPITHFPPFYSLSLAASTLLGKSVIQSARFLNALLFGINVGLFALAVYLTAGRNLLTVVCAVCFFISTAVFVQLHTWAWSEPLFIAFSLSGVLFVSLYVVKPTWSLLIVSALCLGFAPVTRYIGVVMFPGALLLVFGAGTGQLLARRLRNTLIWVTLASAPLAIFLIGNLITAHQATDRSIAFHPIDVSYFGGNFLQNLSNLFNPGGLPFIRPRLAVLALFAGFLIVQIGNFLRRQIRDINWRSIGIVMPVASLLFFVSYMAFLAVSISFFDAATPIDWRLLSPIFVILIIGLFSIMWTVSQTLKKPRVWVWFLLFIVLFTVIKTPNAVRVATFIQQNGEGYTGRQWQDSESVTFAKLVGQDVKIYSNEKAGVDFLTEKDTRSLPEKYSIFSNEANAHYDAEFEAMCKDLKENGAFVLYFDEIFPRYPTAKEIESTCELPVLRRFADGVLYGAKWPDQEVRPYGKVGYLKLDSEHEIQLQISPLSLFCHFRNRLA